MRFKIGAIPPTTDFSPCTPWVPLGEPTPFAMQFLALPVGIVSVVATCTLWLLFTETELQFDNLSLILLTLALLIPIHELIHAAVHPQCGLSNESLLGVWPSRMVFYAHYSGELSRNWFIAILLMPFLIISLLPIFVYGIFGTAPDWLVFASVLNAFFSCGDQLGTLLLLWQVPRSAHVRNQGWNTYWRLLTPESAEQPSTN